MMWQRRPDLCPGRGPAALRLTGFVLLALAVAGCVSTPPPPVPQPEVADTTSGPVTLPADDSLPAPAPRPVHFEDLPGWDSADLTGPVEALSRSCAQWAGRSDTAEISNRVGYAGTVGDWRAACGAIEVVGDSESARRVFEALFTPLEILPRSDESPRFTGYFEPQISARRTPEFPYTQAVPGVPNDFEQVDGSAVGTTPGRTVPAQRLPDGRLRAYPPRAEIVKNPQNILGYAHPADVFFLQIQGSGRLVFEDGSVLRAAYAAHNGQPFRSTANYLLESGKISAGEASMQGIRAWMDRVSRAEAQTAMNANPRFVFFRPLDIGDPALGPEGAQAVPLTPLGSMAIDTSIHPLGIPFFVQTTAPGLGGDWSGLLVGQDTGGAIKGRVRGDIYYGTGDEAGARAGTQNAPGRMWAFLPRAVAARLVGPDQPVS